jgi:hypothetical protein
MQAQQQKAQSKNRQPESNAQQSVSDQQTAAPAVPNTGVEPPINNPIPEPKAQAAAANSQHAPTEIYARNLSRWTGGLVGVGVLTTAVLFLQLCTFNKTDDTLRAAQRPWMKFLRPDFVEPLHYEGNKVTTSMLVHLQNTGNSPALNVIVDAKLTVNDLKTADSQRVLCERYLTPEVGTDQGSKSFPGIEPITPEAALSVQLDNIENPNIDLLNPTFPMWLTIISCITYRFSFDNKPPSNRNNF